jgi:hypothetical protein
MTLRNPLVTYTAVFRLKPSRGKEGVEEFPGGCRPDCWLADRCAAQIGWAAKDQRFCLARLIRDAQCAIDAGDRIFVPGFGRLLKYACVFGQRGNRLKDGALKAYERRLDARLDRLMALRPKPEEGRKLQTAIEGRRRHLFTFMANRKLSPTNDGSPAKSWRRSPSPNPRAMIASPAAQGRMAWTIDSLTHNVSNYLFDRSFLRRARTLPHAEAIAAASEAILAARR